MKINNAKIPDLHWLILFLLIGSILAAQSVTIGAKNFNEGYLMAEILAQLCEDNGVRVDRKFNLGGTLICFEALKNRQIDLYPEYTGTLSEQIFKADNELSRGDLETLLEETFQMEISPSFGFNNSYALAVRKHMAERIQLKKISDLRKWPSLRFAFSYEFLKRNDGWQNLAARYQLGQHPVGIEHGLSYPALDNRKIDLIDVYTTDGEISRYDLYLLEDDLHFFPEYKAVALYRSELDQKLKDVVARLGGRIDEKMMQQLNARVVFGHEAYGRVARAFLTAERLISGKKNGSEPSVLTEILQKTLVHLELTLISLLAAILIAIPLGILVYHFKVVARPTLYTAGLLQTIPSIALLALMIPFFGIGVLPAIIALFLYALLPILRNTASALFSIDPLLKKVAQGIGLTPWQSLRYVELPLAMPTIFAGIKTAAVISIGTATLAAFIGAGGLGEFIVTGLSLNDTALILKGAIPAALLAIIAEFIFEWLEKLVVPKHLLQKLTK